MRGLRLALAAACVLVGAPRAQPETTFFDPQELEFPELGTLAPRPVAVFDVDGDGHDDLFAESWWHAGDGSGTFSAERRTAAGAVLAAYADVVDADGDGDRDLFLSAVNNGDRIGIALVLNAGGGAFSPAPAFPRYGDDVNARAGACLFDLGGDGDLDVAQNLVVAEPVYGATVLEILENDGAGGFARTVRVPTGTVRGRPRAADMDGDGRDDLVLDGGQSLRVCLQRADGGFDALPGASYLGTTQDSRALLRDFDGDGDVDVFTGDLVLRNDGSGALTPDPFAGSRAQPYFYGAMAAGDLDHDGDVDVAGPISGGVAVAWNDGGVLPRPADADADVVFAASGVASLVLQDLDADGRLDFVAALGARSRVEVRRQSGMPPPAALAVAPGVIDRAGEHVLSVTGAGFVDGATADLGPGIVVQEVVADDGHAGVRVAVPEGLGGGTRTLAVANPDRQRTTVTVDVRSVDVTLRSGRLRASPAPARDVLTLSGRLAPNDLSEYGTFAGVERGLRLAVGDGEDAFVLTTAPGDPRWTTSRRGRRLTFRTLVHEYPRVALAVEPRTGAFTLRVSYFDHPADRAGPCDVRYDAGSDRGAAAGAWTPPRRGTTLRLER